MAIRKVHIPGTVTTPNDVRRFIENCYDATLLREFSRRIGEQVKRVGYVKIRQFDLNDRVRFNSKKYGPLTGEIVAINRVKCKVMVTNGTVSTNWTVPFSMLEAV